MKPNKAYFIRVAIAAAGAFGISYAFAPGMLSAAPGTLAVMLAVDVIVPAVVLLDWHFPRRTRES